MLKPVPVQKVRLIGLLDVRKDVLALWQSLGVLHLCDAESPSGAFGAGTALEDYEAISAQLVRLRGIKNSLLPTAVPPAPPEADPIARAQAIAIDSELLSLQADRERLATAISELDTRAAALRRLEGLDVDFSALPPGLDYHLFSATPKDLARAQAEVPAGARKSQWLTAPDPAQAGRMLALLAVPAGTDCAAALKGTDAIPRPLDVPGTPAQARSRLEGRRHELVAEDRRARHRLQELSDQHYAPIVRLEEQLSILADRARAASRFGQSAHCFVAEGWVRQDGRARLEARTQKAFGSKVWMRAVPDSEHHGHGAPTLLENPPVARPFQFLVEFLSLPQAGEIDPTLISMVTIPILYGMIVGDAGYAVISLLLALLINRFAPKGGMLWQFGRIWMVGAATSFVFGVLFDEYFGFGHAKLLGLAAPLYAPLVHRVADVQGLLLLTVIVGCAQLALGFVLGGINEWAHNRKHAYAKLSWLLIEAGGIAAVGVFLLNAWPMEVGVAGLALMAVGAGVVAWGEGPLGLVEIPGLAANIMSFSRIAAVGVGGVILAEAINVLLMPNADFSSPASIAMFVVVGAAYVLAHVVNTALAMFEGFIHGARLNVLEFQGKFFHGGGKPFRPFMAKRVHTLEASGQIESEFA